MAAQQTHNGGQHEGCRQTKRDARQCELQRGLQEQQRYLGQPGGSGGEQQHFARIVAVGEPTATGGADQVEKSHDGEQPARRRHRHAIVGAEGDHVGADQAIGGEAANEEGARQKPEIAVAHAFTQGAEGGADGIGLFTRRHGVIFAGAKRLLIDILRPFRQEEEDHRDQQRHHDGHRGHHGLPALSLGQLQPSG